MINRSTIILNNRFKVEVSTRVQVWRLLFQGDADFSLD